VARPTRLTVVADTGPIYALIDASDSWHARVNAWWERAVSDVVLPVTILGEVTHLLQTRIGPVAEEAFVRAVADREFTIEQIEDDDLPRIADLMHAYRDLPLSFVDASVVAIAERLEARDVLTTDRKHFGVVRPSHVRALSLLP
jgi:predicted nucleic acid-binding protein